VNLLPDTHVVLWWLDDAPSLSASAREALAHPDNTVYLSAVVVWEIRIKEAIGKLEVPADLEAILAEESFVELPVTVPHAHAVAGLPPVHRDPFDRMLVAQARSEGFHVLTRDPVFRRYDVPVLAV